MANKGDIQSVSEHQMLNQIWLDGGLNIAYLQPI